MEQTRHLKERCLMAKPLEGRNFILASLSAADRKRIEPMLELIHVGIHQEIHEPDAPIRYAYFPITAIVSLVTTMEDGRSVEAATVGNEGVVGLPASLESGNATLEAFGQVPGKALRMKVADYRALCREGGPLHGITQRYMQVLFRFVAQSAACNRLHSVETRCARWLLMCHDRVEGDTFELTQEFLAQMLGVRRASVTVAAGYLRDRKLISYRQGRIHIVDRPELEAASCECYAVIRTAFDRLAGIQAVAAPEPRALAAARVTAPRRS